MDESFGPAVSFAKHKGGWTTCPAVNFEATERHREWLLALNRRRIST
jgi:hypothetical protein